MNLLLLSYTSPFVSPEIEEGSRFRNLLIVDQCRLLAALTFFLAALAAFAFLGHLRSPRVLGFVED